MASGAVLVVYLTGQGALNHLVADGTATPDSPLSSATATATATIGGTKATVQFLGLTPGYHRPGAGQYFGADGARHGGLSAGDHGGRIRERFGGGLGFRFGNRAAHVPYAGWPIEFCERQREQRGRLWQHHLPAAVRISINIIDTSSVSAPSYVG